MTLNKGVYLRSQFVTLENRVDRTIAGVYGYRGGYFVKADGDSTSVAPIDPPDTLPIGLLFQLDKIFFATRYDATATVAPVR